MNGINGMGLHPPAVPLWQEARNTEGRVYYYNTITKATQWTKPEELMTPVERALSNQPWKEYTAEGGRKYWYNTETKQSSWEMPDVYKEAMSKEALAPAPIPQQPTFVAGGGFQQPGYHAGGFQGASYDQRDEPINGEPARIAYGNNDVNGSRAQAFVPTNTDPNYSSFEEAESAFLKLLRRSDVQADWTWEQAMRSIIKDPQYRALKDPKDRKAAFEKYTHEVRLQEKDRAKERIAKLRAGFGTMLRSHPEIKHYTRWKTARPTLEGETIFRSTNDDHERRQLFEDYIVELKKAYSEQQALARKAAMDELVDILKSLNLEAYTRWSEAQGIITSNERVQGDEKFKTLSKSDILTAFENHVKELERTMNDAKQEQKNQKSRRERQNRDKYISLLNEMRAAGKIKAGSKWSQIHPLIENDERYISVLGQGGSTPLDLFWDVLEEEERALRGPRNDVHDVLDDKRFEMVPKTTFDEFLVIMQSDRRTANIDRDALSLIFERLHEKASRRNEDDKHKLNRHLKRDIDILRSYIKHLEPPVRLTDSLDSIRPRIEKSKEYLALPNEESRREAFDKVISRLQEKEDEAERDRAKRRERPSVERVSHRDRDRNDRGERSHRPRGRHARSSRSPEPDAYEADRRKAIADREKNHRKGNVADTLLSPPRRGPERIDRIERERGDRERVDRERVDRERMSRERDLDRPHRSRHEPSSYDRERRDREDDREKPYKRRPDGRGANVDELPYGDDRPSGGSRRRRAESDDVDSVGSRRDGRETKRPRRDRSPREPPVPAPRERRVKTRSPPPQVVPVKDDPAVHSGSEEGEIEEE